MRILTVIAGVLLTFLGVFSIANAGLSFLSLAFPIGICLIIVGLVECFVYKTIREDVDAGHWVLIEGLTTFILGIVVLTGRLAADIAVPVVFGMWSMISGIRGFTVLAFETDTREKNVDFWWAVLASGMNLMIGIYTFFNDSLLNLSVLMILGICFVVQGAQVIKIAFDIEYSKPDLIKTKDEKIAEAEAAHKEAKREMKRAIKKVRKARNAVSEAEEAKEFHEIISEPIGETTKEEQDQ